NVEGQGGQGERDGCAHGGLAAVASQNREQADDDQHSDQGGDAAMYQLDRRQSVEGEAEATAAQGPGITAPAGGAADHQRAAQDQDVGAGGGGTRPTNRGPI